MLMYIKIESSKPLAIPNKKAPEGANFKNGADDATWLQPFATIIIRELERMSIDDILCYA